MKILVFGATGKIGKAIAYDLVNCSEVEQVGLVDIHAEALDLTSSWLNSSKVKIHLCDVNNQAESGNLMKAYQVGVIALPNRKLSYKIIEKAFNNGLSCVDILEEFHLKPEVYEIEGLEIPKGMDATSYGEYLNKLAIQKELTLLDGFGFAPGISNVTVGDGIRKMDVAEKAIARVGGVPTKEAASKHPLNYMITWAFSHVLREYMVNLEVIKQGKKVEVEALSELELFTFTELGQTEELECFITPGMPSFPFTRPMLKEFAEKTIRWPGHHHGIMTLKECGLLDMEPVDFKGTPISPREFMLALLEPKLKPNSGETDVCIMYNTVEGKKGNQTLREEYFMWAGYDERSGLSAMARVTGFTAAIGAVMLGKGLIKGKGIVAPEDAITKENYDHFINELISRGIEIKNKTSWI